MKKYFIVGAIVIVGLIVLAGGAFFILKNKEKPEVVPTPKVNNQVIETSIGERPFVSLTPRADGRELTLEISRIKNAETIEYELTYLAGDLSRGVIGTITPQGDTMVSRKLLLGSCSKNMCKYDENVEQGTLTLKFRAADGVRKFTSDFHLQNGVKELSLNDGSFKLESLATLNSYYITMSTIGLPGDVKFVELGPYGIFTSGSSLISGAKVSFADFPGTDYPRPTIFYWTGGEWEGLETETTKLLSTFIVVAQVSEPASQ